MASQLITWALAVALVIFLPRYLGPAAMGQLQLATTVWAIVCTAAGFGSELMMIREIARRPQRTAEIVATVVALRWLFFAVGCAAVAAYVVLAEESGVLVALFVIIGAAQPVLLAGTAVQAALQGQERMQSVALATVVAKSVYTLLAMLAVFAGMDVKAVAVAVVAGNAAHMAVLFASLPAGSRCGWRFRAGLVRPLVVASAPFLAAALLLIGYQETSVIVVAAMLDVEAVGWFSVARTLMSTLLFVPTILATALFPAAARGHVTGTDMLTRIAGRSVKLMLVCGVAVGFGIAVTAEPIISLVYGARFLPSGPILAVFGLSLVATYQTVMLGTLLAASDRQTVWACVLAGVLPVKVLFDILLVWFCDRFLGNGAVGAAVSMMLSEAAMAVIGLKLLPKGTLRTADGWFALRVLLAGTAMAAVAWLLRSDTVVLSVLAGAAVYAALIAAMRVMPPEDIQLLKAVLASGCARMRWPGGGLPGR
jgi:O-antigen/teichoic acid export membrane protein